MIWLTLGIIIWLVTMNKKGKREFDEVTAGRFQLMEFFINWAAGRYNVPRWILYRIAFIESAFDYTARGSTGDYGLFQVTNPVLIDFNALNPHFEWYSIDQLLEPQANSDVAAWLVARLLRRFNRDIEKAVKAYNAGPGGINSNAAQQYYNRFQEAGDYFPEE